MTTEQSKGKARTVLPRSSDLEPAGTERVRSQGRDAAGRAAAGNRLAEGRRWKQTIKRIAGAGVGVGEVAIIAEDARRLFAALLLDLPTDGASVRQLVALQARHAALAAYWTARAEELGPSSEQGLAAEEQATKHGVRVERLAVTSLDVATKMVSARARPVSKADAHTATVTSIRALGRAATSGGESNP